MRKHRKYCLKCQYKDFCINQYKNKPDKCPIGEFDEYDK